MNLSSLLLIHLISSTSKLLDNCVLYCGCVSFIMISSEQEEELESLGYLYTEEELIIQSMVLIGSLKFKIAIQFTVRYVYLLK